MSVEVENKLRTIVSKLFLVDEAEVSLNDDLVEDLRADSLDIVELVMEIEDHFNMEIEEDDSDRWKTFGDVVRYVVAKGK